MDTKALEKLKELKEKGIITEEEFKQKKTELLNEINKPSINQQDKSLWAYFMECMTTKYFCFRGRARRKELWSLVLFSTLTQIIISILSILIFVPFSKGEYTMMTSLNATTLVASTLVGLCFLCPLIGVYFRRLNDISLGMSKIANKLIGNAMIIGRGLIIFSFVAFMIPYFRFYGYILPGLISTILLIEFFFLISFMPSDSEENKYGPVPDGASTESSNALIIGSIATAAVFFIIFALAAFGEYIE